MGPARCSQETRLPLATFPEVCSGPVAQVMAEDFWPEASSMS
jgi:hypothetical protein